MRSKRIFVSFTAICIAAILAIALCGCEDLGDYSSVEEYYGSFGDVVLVDGVSAEQKKYSVEEYFYNKESQQNFLVGEDGSYGGVDYEEYVYVAIPFESDMEMDSIALYLQSKSDVTLYINVYLTRAIPSNFKSIEDIDKQQEPGAGLQGDAGAGDETNKIEYDDPDPDMRIGEVTLYLKSGKWTSFTLNSFNEHGAVKGSVGINKGQYILLQIRNNSGVRVYDEEKKLYVDEQTGLELQRAEITMTNLLVRALSVADGMEEQGGE